MSNASQPALFGPDEEGAADPEGKAPGAYRTIGEVADALGVPQHVLRFWETQFPDIAPARLKGRRYYTPETVTLIARIRDLLYTEGYTLKGALHYLKGGNAQEAEAPVLNNPQRDTLISLREKLAALHRALS